MSQKFSGKNDHEASTSKANVDNKGKGKALDPGFFICGGLHRAKQCPKREKLNALIFEEDEALVEETISRVNPLSLLNSIRKESRSDTGLMFVDVKVNGQVLRQWLTLVLLITDFLIGS